MKLITTSLLAALPMVHGKAIGAIIKNGGRDINIGGVGLDTVLGATGSVDLGLPVGVNIALPPVASQGTAILTGTASGDFDVVLHAFSSISVALQNLVRVTNHILIQLNVNVHITKRQSSSADLTAALTAAINAINGGTNSLNGIEGSLSLTQAAALLADQVAIQTAVTAFVGILITNQGIFVQACLGADIRAQAGSLLNATANLQAALNAKMGLVDLSSLGLTYQPTLDLIQSLVGAYAGQDVLPAACVVSSSSTIITSSSPAPFSSSAILSTSVTVSTGSSTMVSTTSSGIGSSSSIIEQSSSSTGTLSSSTGIPSSSTTKPLSSSTGTPSSTTASMSSSGLVTSSAPIISSAPLTTPSTTSDVSSSSMLPASTTSLASVSTTSGSSTLYVGVISSSASSIVVAPSDMPQGSATDSNASAGPSNGVSGGPTSGSNMNANPGDNAVSSPYSGVCTCAQGVGSGSGVANDQAGTGQTPSKPVNAATPSSTSIKYTGAASIAGMDATLGIVAGLAILLAL